METTFSPTRASKSRCFIFMGVLLSIYLLDNLSLSKYIGGQVFNYILKPILWFSIIYATWRLPKMRPKSLIKNRSMLNLWALNFAVIYIIINVIFGIFIEFGRSPYNQSLYGIFINIIFVGFPLVGREVVRNYMVHNITNKEKYIIFSLISLFISFTTISFSNYTNIKGIESLIKFCAEVFIPELSKNIFLTYFVYIGGPLPAIIYQGIIEAFQCFSPILPNLNWLMKALVGIIIPLFSFIALQGIYININKKTKKKRRGNENLFLWMSTNIVSILIIWFVVGVFPIYPSVIVTGSMEPMIKPGDVILIEKVQSTEDIHIEDVIQFERDGVLISHRIIEIKQDKEGICYVTKGDNNSIPDFKFVQPNQIKGKIIKVIPKIGWPTLLIKKRDDINLEDIEF